MRGSPGGAAGRFVPRAQVPGAGARSAPGACLGPWARWVCALRGAGSRLRFLLPRFSKSRGSPRWSPETFPAP